MSLFQKWFFESYQKKKFNSLSHIQRKKGFNASLSRKKSVVKNFFQKKFQFSESYSRKRVHSVSPSQKKVQFLGSNWINLNLWVKSKKVQFFESYWKKRVHSSGHVREKSVLNFFSFIFFSKISIFWVTFKKMGSIHWVVLKKKFVFLSHTQKEIQFFESYSFWLKRGSILSSHVHKEFNSLRHIQKKRFNSLRYIQRKGFNSWSYIQKKSSILWVIWRVQHFESNWKVVLKKRFNSMSHKKSVTSMSHWMSSILWVIFLKKMLNSLSLFSKSSILWVIVEKNKRVQFFESFFQTGSRSKKMGSISMSHVEKKAFNSVSCIRKRGSILWMKFKKNQFLESSSPKKKVGFFESYF